MRQQKKTLRNNFTNPGHPGESYANEIEELYKKLKDCYLMPSFLNLINDLCGKTKKKKNDLFSFSLIFRTFGSDLNEVIDSFNSHCLKNKETKEITQTEEKTKKKKNR